MWLFAAAQVVAQWTPPHPDRNRPLELHSAVTAISYDTTHHVYSVALPGGEVRNLPRDLVRVVGAEHRTKKTLWKYTGEPFYYLETARYDGQPWARPAVVDGVLLTNKRKHQ